MERRRIEPLVSVTELERGPRARFQALSVLCQADDRDRFVDSILDERVGDGVISARDRYLIQEMVYGAVRHRNSIDYILDHYIQFSMRRHDVAIRWGLRLAAYQIIYLSRIPPHAAIHGTLEAMKAYGGLQKRDIGFANAVLRRLQNDIREKAEDPVVDDGDRNVLPARHGWCRFSHPVLPPPGAGRNLFLAIKYSHPKWLVTRWIERFGEADTIPLCLENNRVPLVSAILTDAAPSKDEVIASLEEAEVTVEPGSLEESVRLRRPGDITRLEAFDRRWIRIQDETAKKIGDALEPPPGARVLDLCAGPGGKAAQILERVGAEGSLLACDVNDVKLQKVRENLDRVGHPYEIRKVSPDPETLDLGETFTHILVDAPCSNTGVLARRPEARWRIHQDSFPKLARLQGQLLDAALRHLAPGGRLVYSTCSIEPDENGQVVSAFRHRHPRVQEVASRLFLPHRDGSDGGYYAVLEDRG